MTNFYNFFFFKEKAFKYFTTHLAILDETEVID